MSNNDNIRRVGNSKIKKNSNHERLKKENANTRIKKSEIKHKVPKGIKNLKRKTHSQKLESLEEVYVGVGEMDYMLLFVVVALVLIGIIMVFSASSYQSTSQFGTPYKFFIKQSFFAVAGFIGLMFTSKFHYKKFMTGWPVFLYVTSAIFLIIVMLFGTEVNGAKRWLYIPGTPIGFQPSEVAKISIIIFVSSMIAKRPKILNSLKGIIQVGAFIVILALLIGIENMSTAIIVMLIGFGIIFVVSPYTKAFIALAISGVVGMFGYLAYTAFFTDSFRGGRFTAWLDPFSDKLNYGFQTVQSLYAIGSGGFFGLGLGNSRQKLAYLPESHNDIIFAIICEELGLLGAIIIIGLYMVLIYRGVQIALKAPDLFGTLVAFGIVILVSVQVIINIAVCTNTIPNTGIALPFISYGGTSLIIMISTMGILLNISRYTRK